jgi:metal-sulfur cluster biosynthetic enzyme
MDERTGAMTEDASAAASPPAAVRDDDDAQASAGADERSTGPAGPSADEVRVALKQVYDPELGLNIVDLGLVYDVRVDERGDVDIQYTLTTMGCPIGPLIEDQIRAFLAPLPGIGEIRAEFVIRPAWTPEMMSDEAKAALGIF